MNISLSLRCLLVCSFVRLLSERCQCVNYSIGLNWALRLQCTDNTLLTAFAAFPSPFLVVVPLPLLQLVIVASECIQVCNAIIMWAALIQFFILVCSHSKCIWSRLNGNVNALSSVFAHSNNANEEKINYNEIWTFEMRTRFMQCIKEPM